MMPRSCTRHFLLRLLLPALVLLPGLADLSQAADSTSLDFNKDIRPILSQNCFACHGPDSKARKAKLRLDTLEGATEEHDGIRAVVPGDLEASELVARIRSAVADETMPPPESKKKLSAAQKSTLERWIKEGAEYKDHWAFLAPVKKSPPAVKHGDWPQNAIDHFLLAQLESSNLGPSPEATKERLIRRVTFDLTGEPPSIDAIDAYVADKSPKAFEKVVDRLLASPAYGERMALAWMDAARYGDTSVMHADGPRDMWPWRDWTIRAYNSNKPYHEFVSEQIAGDLMPNATNDQKLATGFNRNHATSDEGGAIAEELRVDYVVDRVKTTANVFLGLSMECGQCHDHKYDPITQKEYYQFFAYFNNTKDPGMQTRNGNQSPTVPVSNPDRDKGLAEFDQKIKTVSDGIDARKKEASAAVEAWAAAKAKELGDPKAVAKMPGGLVHHFPLNDKKPGKAKEILTSKTGSSRGKPQTEKRGAVNALKLNGKTSIDFPGVGEFKKHDQAFSIAAWVKVPKGVTGALLSRMKTAAAYRGYDLWLQNGGIGAHVINAWPDNAVKVVSKTKLRNDQWEHVAVRYDGSGKAAGLSVFINGVKSAVDVEQDGLTGDILADVPFRIGGRDTGATFRGSVSDIRIYNRALADSEFGALMQGKDPLKELLAVPSNKRTKEQRSALANLYLDSEDAAYKKLVTDRSGLEKQKADFMKKNKSTTSMVMEDNPKRRVTYILDRGHYGSPRKEEEIPPGTPSMLPPLPEGAGANRLGLAQWMVRPDHPLTARVAINRYWTMLFGTGLVKTVMDFGNQGGTPSHPELLDWLAVDFVESGWNVKGAIKQMVMSSAYRQSSRITPELLKADPENLLISRGPRFRLQGEFIRDQALAVSGLLVDGVGGPGVKPYQPPGLWNEVSLNAGLRFKQDNGDKLYRKSMYIYWRRSAPMPSMSIFDAPTREKCVVQRSRTNTPLQALVTLNDVQFVEASRELAARMIREGGADFSKQVQVGYRLCTSRAATAEEIGICRSVYEQQLASFRETPENAAKYLKHGETPTDEKLDPIEHAALAVIANMILNLDEVLTRG